MRYVKILSLILITLLNSGCSKAKTPNTSNDGVQAKPETIEQSGFIQQKITEQLYVLKHPNYNTNVGVFIGEEGVLLVDPMSGMNNHENLLDVVKQLSDKEIKYVINTHSHSDHSGANTFFSELGATIISHENVKYSRAMYDVTFKDTYTLDMGTETIEFYHGIAHTFDDVLVYFKNNNAVFMGDTYMTNSFPHFYYGGGSKGHLNIIDKALALGDENTTVVPAHGKLAVNKKELTSYRENSVKWIGKINQLHSEGKTAEEMADNEQIKQLSLIFNGISVPYQRVLQTINKTISAEIIPSVELSENILRKYEGIYQYENGQVDEIIYQNGSLILRSEGNYLFEIVPLSQEQFHLRGQFPNKYLTFDNDQKRFTYFNGKEELVAERK